MRWSALFAAHEPPPSAVGNVAQLLHVDVDHRPWMVVFVATDGFAGDPVDMAEPVDAAAHQDRVDGRGGQTEFASDLNRAETPPPPRF